MNRNWASRPLDSNICETLSALRHAYSVTVISTMGRDLRKCPADNLARLDHEEFAEFDYVPTTSGGSVSGVYCRSRKEIVPLDESMLLPATYSLLDYIENADQFPFSLIVGDRQVIGIVTLSDLQKLPVYYLIFNLVASVEMRVVDYIRVKCKDEPDKWLSALNSDGRRQVERWFTKAVDRNVAIDRLSVANFQQEIDAAVLYLLNNSGRNPLFRSASRSEQRDFREVTPDY